MSAFNELLLGSSVSHFVISLGLVIAIGVALGRVKICGVSLGAAFVLLAGIAVSHIGMKFPQFLCSDANGAMHFIDPVYTRLIQELGLILFLYAVGLQSGKGFFKTFKKGGLTLNLLAASVVVMDVAIALILYKVSGVDMGTIVGVLSGAVTNTPGLGAAQTIYQEMGSDPSVLASAYAAAYPFGVLGIIFTIIAIRIIFKVDVDGENQSLKAAEEAAASSNADNSQKRESKTPAIIPICVGLLLGVLIGSVPICVPGIPQPLKLGIAGGALVAAILMSSFGEKLHFPTRLSASALNFLRTMGVCLFLACVGLRAGETFFSTVANGGLLWMGMGAVITVTPLLIAGIVGYAVCKIDYFSLSGVLAGCMTDPPALSYSCGAFKNDKPSVSYAAVNPLSMFLRIVAAQLLIILFA